MYEYAATLVHVTDGDTLVVDMDLGFEVTMRCTLRLNGIDTPELHDKDPAVRAKAQSAKQFAETYLTQGRILGLDRNTLMVRTYKDCKEKYGRYLADVTRAYMPTSLNQALLDAGLAVPYSGGAKA